ncbi:sucrase ferredoxin [Streptomyces natalensis]|uniref:Sucrase ferredoxin n=1 Tax=Streptomyces natalensis ATCC 27448 TaxID=1240678 RepID=A0A0D7CF10_9ACTN|nr:sucrase ferredoxin [Streptomyces natalensis]KIZ14656.1 sucrase ferredoxin [Streptomyces natalensis ATCC 27448]
MSTCATASRETAEPVAGTAATARTWLLIEQPGPWGANALTHSHLDPHLGRALEAAADGTGVRVALIRRPGRHADCHDLSRRRLFVAHTAPGNSWIRTTTVTDPRDILRLDFAALGAGNHGGIWDPYTGEPLVLVCTNGKRDRCCALLGRPLAAELAAGGAESWEVTHIGGHRFSPTLFVLPYGYAYGRASAPLVKDAVEAARDGRITLDHCRGRSAWDRPAQAADLAVRELIREERADALDVVRTDEVRPGPGRGDRTPVGGPAPGDTPAWSVAVTHTDGRAWRVAVEQRTDGAPTPASCGAPLGPPARMTVTSIAALTGTRAPACASSLALPAL